MSPDRKDGAGVQAGKVICGNFCYLCRQTAEFIRCNLKKVHGLAILYADARHQWAIALNLNLVDNRVPLHHTRLQVLAALPSRGAEFLARLGNTENGRITAPKSIRSGRAEAGLAAPGAHESPRKT